MRFNGILVIIILKFPLFLEGQNLFIKKYAGGSNVAGTSVSVADSGYVFTGNQRIGVGNNWDIFLLKTDWYGDTLWTRRYATNDFESAHSVNQTSDGGFILACQSFYGGILIKTDSNGDTLWAKRFTNAATEQLVYAEQCNDGGYILAGKGGFNGNGSMYFAKTDSIGNILWAKTYKGWFYYLYPEIHQTSDGGFIIVSTYVDSTASVDDIYLLKTDSIGNFQWGKTYDYGRPHDIGFSVKQTPSNGFIIGASTIDSLGYSFGNLLNTDSLGNVNWSFNYIGSTSLFCFNAIQSYYSGFVMIGQVDNLSATNWKDAIIIKVDSLGALVWSNRYDSDETDEVYELLQTPDEGYLITGFVAGPNFSDESLYAIKVDSMGNTPCNSYTEQLTVSVQSVSTTNVTDLLTPVTLNTGTSGLVIGSGTTVTDICNSVGYEEDIKLNASVIPNPTKGVFSIRTDYASSDFKIKLFDLVGREVQSLKMSNGDEANIENLPNGCYIYSLFDSDRYLGYGRIIKE